MIIAVIFTNILVFVAGLMLFLWVRRKISDATSQIYEFFTPPDDKTPSQFAQLTDAVGAQFASRIVNSARATFMQGSSVDARNAKALEGDIVTDLAASQNPLLGAILEQFPSVGKRLRKNPDLLPLGLQLLQKFSGGGRSAAQPTPPSGGNGHSSFGSMNKF